MQPHKVHLPADVTINDWSHGYGRVGCLRNAIETDSPHEQGHSKVHSSMAVNKADLTEQVRWNNVTPFLEDRLSPYQRSYKGIPEVPYVQQAALQLDSSHGEGVDLSDKSEVRE